MKNLSINAAICDVRKATEEALSAYEVVKINAACIVTNQAAQALLAKHRVKINATKIIFTDEEIRLSVVNGPMSIAPGRALPEEGAFLIVNAPLDIAPGSEEILKQYVGMTINGPISCPESMTGLLGAFQINGPINAYPDGSIVLKSTTALDHTFHLRAKQDALYYAARKVLALAPDIAFDKLAEKNVRFATKRLVVAESLAEAAVPLFDDRADITIVPDGCACVAGDAVLNEMLLKRYGGKLYIGGDLVVTPESAALLDQIAYLRANDLLVCRSLNERILASDFHYDELRVVGSTIISERAKVALAAAELEAAQEGVSVMNCAKVVIGENVTPELLREKLVGISCCAKVICATEEQKVAVEPLTSDVAKVTTGSEGELREAENDQKDADTTSINATNYVL